MVEMRAVRLWVDKISSATLNVELRREVRLDERIVAKSGYVVVGRIHGEKAVYNQLEDVHGRLVLLHDGDVIAGVLGHRNALQGYSGVVPDSVQVGDRLQLLNTGGVIGRCTSENPDVGRPFDVEILGAVLVFPQFEDRSGVPAHIGMNAVDCTGQGVPDVPLIFVAGTCMNSGKTVAACQLLKQLSKRRMAVGGCKLTGVSLRRDTLRMADYGAKWSVSFNEAGIVSTSNETAVPMAQGLMRHLSAAGAEVVVAELGDGILGEYGVAPILSDSALMGQTAAIVMCANDPVGAWGAKRVMQEKFDLAIDVICGPATDNAVGTDFVTRELGIRAINARTHGPELGDFIAKLLDKWRDGKKC